MPYEATRPTLYHVHDPMCSWCWAFRPVPPGAATGELALMGAAERLLGGLAPDSDQPMPPEMRAKIEAIWRHIPTVVPGTEFNHEFWRRCSPRRSTYPACRAVISAKKQGREYEEPMMLAIQHAYYRDARNPSDDAVLIDLAAGMGLNAVGFTLGLNSADTHGELAGQINVCKRLGAEGFPSLIFANGDSPPRTIGLDYNAPEAMLEQICRGC